MRLLWGHRWLWTRLPLLVQVKSLLMRLLLWLLDRLQGWLVLVTTILKWWLPGRLWLLLGRLKAVLLWLVLLRLLWLSERLQRWLERMYRIGPWN